MTTFPSNNNHHSHQQRRQENGAQRLPCPQQKAATSSPRQYSKKEGPRRCTRQHTAWLIHNPRYYTQTHLHADVSCEDGSDGAEDERYGGERTLGEVLAHSHQEKDHGAKDDDKDAADCVFCRQEGVCTTADRFVDLRFNNTLHRKETTAKRAY